MGPGPEWTINGTGGHLKGPFDQYSRIKNSSTDQKWQVPKDKATL